MKVATMGNMEKIAGELDAVSDYEHHPDVGCEAAKEYYGYYGKCTDCQIEPCFEEPGGMKKGIMIKRDAVILELIKGGLSNEEMAEKLGVSKWIIQASLVRSTNGH